MSDANPTIRVGLMDRCTRVEDVSPEMTIALVSMDLSAAPPAIAGTVSEHILYEEEPALVLYCGPQYGHVTVVCGHTHWTAVASTEGRIAMGPWELWRHWFMPAGQ